MVIIKNKTLFIVFLGIVGCGPIPLSLQKVGMAEKLKNSYLEIMYCGTIVIFCIVSLASNTYNPFIYFRF